jgi:hypothetical protein
LTKDVSKGPDRDIFFWVWNHNDLTGLILELPVVALCVGLFEAILLKPFYDLFAVHAFFVHTTHTDSQEFLIFFLDIGIQIPMHPFPDKSVHVLCDQEALCPFLINKQTSPEAQMWIFTNQIR